MKLVVGLGNPGSRYAASRHNVGYMCVDLIGSQVGITLSDRRELAGIGQGTVEGQDLVLVKPRTFMNNSGEACSYLLSRFHVPSEDLLIIYDDMDLPLGKIRIRPSGSAGGHRGLASIISTLRSQDIPRIRVGIGRPPTDAAQIGFVLGSFDREEERMVQETVATVGNAVVDILVHGLDRAMNLYN